MPEYDSLGRLSKTTTSLGVAGALGDHYEKITYDQYGRTYQVFDAARSSNSYLDNGTQNHYNSHGYLYKVTSAEQLNGQPASTYHTIQSMDARGNIVSEELGNGVTRSATYEHNTGLLQNLQATSASTPSKTSTCNGTKSATLSSAKKPAMAATSQRTSSMTASTV